MDATPLRLTYYIPAIRLEQGGVVRAVLDWCTVFARRGHKVRLFVYEAKDLPADWLKGLPGLPLLVVLPNPFGPGKLFTKAALKIVDAALADSDVLHLNAPWLDGNRQLARLARRRHVPYVVTVHGMLDDWSMSQRGSKKRLYMKLFGTRFLDRAAAVHCTAEGERRQASKWFHNKNVPVLPCMLDITQFEDMPGPGLARAAIPALTCECRLILFLSRLHEKKGLELLLRAFALLRQRGAMHRLIIAGNGDPGYVNSLKKLANELGIAEATFFVGLVVGPEKISLYEACDVFVLPTMQENFGIVLVEALACCLPVVTTKGTDIYPEVSAAGGLITDWQPASIADAVSRILAETDGERGPRGRRWVLENLATEPLAAKYESLYRSLSSAAPSLPPTEAGSTPAVETR